MKSNPMHLFHQFRKLEEDQGSLVQIQRINQVVTQIQMIVAKNKKRKRKTKLYFKMM